MRKAEICGSNYLPMKKVFIQTICECCALIVHRVFPIRRHRHARQGSSYLHKSVEQPSLIKWPFVCGCKHTFPALRHRTVRLTMGHIVDKSKGGEDTPGNLRAVCTNCNEGLQNTALPKPDRIHLLAQIRRATIDDQQAVLDWLLGKFGLAASKKI